jgi:hypothetical protein
VAEHRTIHLLYPEDRYVLDDTIEGWFWDAVADGDIRPSDWFEHTPHLEGMIEALSDIGVITVAKD